MRNFLCSILEKAECVDSLSVEKFNTIDEYNFFNKKIPNKKRVFIIK